MKFANGKSWFLGLSLIVAAFLAIHGLSNGASAQMTPATAGQFTIEQIGQALDKYGKNTITENGQTNYSLTVSRGKWNINVIVSLSPNHTVIWMTNNLVSIPDTSKASPDALAKLLEKNTEIGPMFFGIIGSDHSIQLSNPIPNFNMTPEAIQKQVEALVSTVLDTAALWDSDALRPTAAAPSAPVNPFGR